MGPTPEPPEHRTAAGLSLQPQPLELLGFRPALRRRIDPQRKRRGLFRGVLPHDDVRIALRDRSYERNMERGYIDELNHAYDEFFSKPYDHTPVLTIDTDLINIVQNPDDLKEVENRIKQALGITPFQPGLPMQS